MSFHQPNPSIPVTVIGKGDGDATAVIDNGQEHNLIWGTALDETAEVWRAPNPLERLQALRATFYKPGLSLGKQPLSLLNQSATTPAFAKFVENQRWVHQGVVFATLHIVGSNNNFEVRDPRAVAEFFEREKDKNYFFEEPASPAESQMMIVSGGNKHRMIFLTENSEDSFLAENR